MPRPRCLAAVLTALLAVSMPAHGGTLIRIGTPFGPLLAELYDEEKPATVRNFLRYVESGFWADLFAYRLDPGFVIQAGGYVAVERDTPNAAFVRIPRFDPVTNEFATGPRLSNVRGTLAMAKLGNQPDSATAEWFINLGDNSSELDDQNGGFTVFGRVISGDGMLDVFNTFTWRKSLEAQSTNRLYQVGDSPPFNRDPPAFPVLQVLANTGQLFTNLLTLEVGIVTLAARPMDGPLQGITWSAPPGVEQRVEAAGDPAGPWRVLWSGIPVPPRPSVNDPDPGTGPRFYRIRIGDELPPTD
ncbi:MAG: peptidylprolyl isomerase [Verrucomicrobia bacterium]|nr:peptidylprolyl isomerase [Verrucomicrobiota bacterium]